MRFSQQTGTLIVTVGACLSLAVSSIDSDEERTARHELRGPDAARDKSQRSQANISG
jgi:hypothetical protein